MKWDAKRRAYMPEFTDTVGGKFVATILLIVCVTCTSVLFMGTQTLLDLTSQVRGVLPAANGGSGTASTLTGIVRGGSPMTAAELSGDCTTSGSNVITCQKDNGTTIPTNSAADQVLGTNASATGVWISVPNCTGALQYSTSTHTFTCGTVLTGTFADAEVPTGLINSANTTYALAHTPSPAASVLLLKNGQALSAGGADYTLATATITMTSAPKTGDLLVAWYRF